METMNRRMQEEVRQLELIARKKQLEEVIQKPNTNEHNNTGPYGWYRHPTEEQIKEARIGKADRDTA